MSIDGKYSNASVTFKKKDRWMIYHIKDIAQKRNWPIAFTMARLIEAGLKTVGITNEKKA